MSVSIQKIIPEGIIQQLKLAVFFVGVIQKKYADQAIKVLRATNSKVEEKSYLKRVKKYDDQHVKIILAMREQTEILEGIKHKMKEVLVEVIQEELPDNPPLTKDQFEEWSSIWPINFIEPQFMKPTLHSLQQEALIQSFIQQQKKFTLFDQKQKLFQLLNEPKCVAGTINHAIMKLLNEWPQTQKFANGDYYYLTGLRLLLKTQICGMCCMALVHNRCERIYIYNFQMSQTMKDILHCPKMNHRIQLFQVKNA